MTKSNLKYILRLNRKNLKSKYSLKIKEQIYKENAYVINRHQAMYAIYFCKDGGKYQIFTSPFLEEIYEKLCWLLVSAEDFKSIYYSLT